jgi:hypothetical protein
VTERALTEIVVSSGLWEGGRRSTHSFLLSPDVFRLSRAEADKFETLSIALYECLGGLGRIAAVASMPRVSRGPVWGMIARVINIGVPKYYQGIQHQLPGRVPTVCKIDLLESEDGRFLIAEIDGHNKHGLGYSELAARCRRAVAPEGVSFPGVVAALKSELNRRGTDTLTILYADQERFYLPEMEVLRLAFAEQGLTLVLACEKDIRVESGSAMLHGKPFAPSVLLDLPFLFHNPPLLNWLVGKAQDSEIEFLIPPKPFLGSKAMLALLRNEANEPELEAILRAFIRAESLELVRQAIPATYLVGHSSRQPVLTSVSPKFVLKESISSGMKGTLFMENAKFVDQLKAAESSPYRFILQEEVTNRARQYRAYRDGELVSGEWFQRITMHIIGRQIADIVVTARQDKSVHGAPDCLQLGTIIEPE